MQSAQDSSTFELIVPGWLCSVSSCLLSGRGSGPCDQQVLYGVPIAGIKASVVRLRRGPQEPRVVVTVNIPRGRGPSLEPVTKQIWIEI